MGETSVSAAIIKSLLHHRTPIYDTRRFSCTGRQTVPPTELGDDISLASASPSPPFEMRYGHPLEPLPLTQVRKGGDSCCDISVVPPPMTVVRKRSPDLENLPFRPPTTLSQMYIGACGCILPPPPAFLVTQATICWELITFPFSCMKTAPSNPCVAAHRHTNTSPSLPPLQLHLPPNGEQRSMVNKRKTEVLK